MARFNTNVHAKSHERVKLDGFRGVDTSSASVDVETFRATEMRNMISRNGLNHKRHGWEQQLLNIKNETLHPNNFGGAVQGIYGFKFAGETQTRIIVYANKCFFQKIGNGVFEKMRCDSQTLEDRPCQFYLIGDCLYIIGCGDFLFFGLDKKFYDSANQKLMLLPVSQYAYVPTSLINIASEEYNASTESPINSVSNEPVNLLSDYRKNVLLSKLDGVETFNLISSIKSVKSAFVGDAKLEYRETLSFVEPELLEKTNEIYIKLADINSSYFYRIYLNFEPTDTNLKLIVYSSDFPFKGLALKRQGATISLYQLDYDHNNLSQQFGFGAKDNDGKWYIDIDIEKSFGNSEIVAVGDEKYFKFYAPNMEVFDTEYITLYKQTITKTLNLKDNGEEWAEIVDNKIIFNENAVKKDKEIIIEYEDFNSHLKERIIKCNVSTLFGVNGHSDRMFVAGNDTEFQDWEAKQVVQWSEIDNFTYFPDTNYTRLGTQATGINGMQRLNDDSLCFFKEPSVAEPTIYVMHGEYATDSEGNTKDIFRTYAGNVAEGLIAPNSTGNLAGDILMLSPNGVFGIEMSENVVSTSKYTKERSLPIKRLLKEFSIDDLKAACAIVRDDRYMLCVSDKCFVAESRYSYKPKGSPRDTFSYEWYVWDNIPALCFAEIDGELYFGTADGRLCKFDDKFTDRTIEDFGASSVSENGTITVDEVLNKGENIVVYNELYGLVAQGNDNIAINNRNAIYFTEENFSAIRFLLNQELFIKNDNIDLTKINIVDVDDANLKIVLSEDLPDSLNNLAKDSINVYISLKDKDLTVINPDVYEEEGQQVAVAFNEVPITSFYHTNESGVWTCRKSVTKNVVAEWFSAIMDFGTPDYSKTLLGFTVAPERIEGDNMEFGYITRELDSEEDVKMLRKNISEVTESPLNLGNLSMFFLSFNTFQTSFTKKVKVRNFNYLMWFVKSDSPTDSAVNSIIFDYKVNRKNKGVN